MISHISQTNKSCIISVELEKERPELANFIHLPDVLFVSKEYAGYHGYQSAQEACTGFRRQAKESAIIVCAWGDKGAAATDSNGQLYTSPVYTPPGGVVDTLGAGDTFIGAVIHKLLDKTSVHEAIVYGCRVAGTKCGMKGFDQLKSCDFIN
jgi:ketohexokinase